MTKKIGTRSPKNPRKISDARLSALGVSIQRFGDLSVITKNVTTGNIVSGNQRSKVIEQSDFDITIQQRFRKPSRTGTVAVGRILLDGEWFAYREVKWDERTETEAMIAANKHGGEWDNDVLMQHVRALEGVDFTKLGFEQRELAKLLEAPPEQPAAEHASEKRLKELASKWRVQPGDIWAVGQHRIICGDSTSRKTLDRLFDDAGTNADMIYTDPPYGVDYKTDGKALIANDELKGNRLAQFLIPALRHAAFYAKDTAAFYVWHASSTRRDFEAAMDAVGLIEKQYIVWVKESFVLGRSDYHWQTEPCFYASKAGFNCPFYGDRTQSTVWRIAEAEAGQTFVSIATGLHVTDGKGASLFLRRSPPKTSGKLRHIRVDHGQKLVIADERTSTDAWEITRDNATEYLHPTQKPVALAARAIENSSKPGDLVLDVFHGGAATMVAAEQTGRRCFAVELAPAYVAMALERMSDKHEPKILSRHGKEVKGT